MNDKQYHFIGIGGIGMSGLARILLERGSAVSGSDARSSPIVQKLEELGAKIFIGHCADQLPKNPVIVYSTDIKPHNPEYMEAKNRGAILCHRSEFLQELMKDSSQLLVAGTHGKTTTSALLAHALVRAGINPSYCVGGVVTSLGSQSGHGRGKWFVAEADESDGSFLSYTPAGMIVTNIEQDHMNYWKTEDNLIRGFKDFFQKGSSKELCFWCADDPILAELNMPGVSYGFSPKAELRITQASYLGYKSRFSFTWKNQLIHNIEIPLIGAHNVLNAAAVCGLCLQIGVEAKKLSSLLEDFQGVGRRSEKKGEASQIAVYDDYAHHPTEISVTIAAFKKAFAGKRVIVLFQPHRFTRTRDCFEQFGSALQEADLVLLTDVYGAGEEPIPGVDSLKLCEEISLTNCLYVPKEDLVKKALTTLQPNDVCLTMGAGDITLLGQALLQELAKWDLREQG
jgi:UDP-N-acetylmuramate--alanine ligase